MTDQPEDLTPRTAREVRIAQTVIDDCLEDRPERVRRGEIVFSDWAGVRHKPCLIVGETPTRYRIRALPGERLHLPRRTIAGDETYLIRKQVVRVRTEGA